MLAMHAQGVRGSCPSPYTRSAPVDLTTVGAVVLAITVLVCICAEYLYKGRF